MSKLFHRRATLPAILLSSLVLIVVATEGAARTSGPLSVVPDPADFGTVTLGHTAVLELNVRNTTATRVVIDEVRVEPSVFSITVDGCGGISLGPNLHCLVQVQFSAQGTREFRGRFEVRTREGTSSAQLRATVPPVTVPRASTTTTIVLGTSTIPPVGTVTTRTTVPAPGTSAPSPTTTLLSDKERLEECDRQARAADVRFEPRREMQVRETAQVAAVASLPGTGAETTVLPFAAPTTVVPVSLRCEVEARLYGSDFEVNPGGFQQGSFLDQPSITWSWDVVPLKQGERTLTLEVRGAADIGGRRIPGGGNPFYATISVGAKPENLGEKITRWSRETVEHPLISGFGSLVLVGGSVAAAWRWLLKRPWPWTKN